MKAFTIISTFLFISIIQADDKFQKQAQSVLTPFKKMLMGNLKQGMKKGVVSALELCQQQAPRISQNLNTGEYKMGRTSKKYRNPNNAPEAWMKSLLDEYAKSNASKKMPPRTLLLDDGRQAYVEPIYIKKLCLHCHGSQVRDSVKESLNKKYPQDLATGYQLDDFRGFFWVTKHKKTKRIGLPTN